MAENPAKVRLPVPAIVPSRMMVNLVFKLEEISMVPPPAPRMMSLGYILVPIKKGRLRSSVSLSRVTVAAGAVWSCIAAAMAAMLRIPYFLKNRLVVDL